VGEDLSGLTEQCGQLLKTVVTHTILYMMVCLILQGVVLVTRNSALDAVCSCWCVLGSCRPLKAPLLQG
jgi:hypothetical protein